MFFGHKIHWKKGIKRKDKSFKPLILLGFLICLNYTVWTYICDNSVIITMNTYVHSNFELKQEGMKKLEENQEFLS